MILSFSTQLQQLEQWRQSVNNSIINSRQRESIKQYSMSKLGEISWQSARFKSVPILMQSLHQWQLQYDEIVKQLQQLEQWRESVNNSIVNRCQRESIKKSCENAWQSANVDALDDVFIDYACDYEEADAYPCWTPSGSRRNEEVRGGEERKGTTNKCSQLRRPSPWVIRRNTNESNRQQLMIQLRRIVTMEK